MTQPQQPDSSLGLMSYFQIPTTYQFVSLHSAAGYLELMKFVHNDVVTIPNKDRKILANIQIVNEGEYYIMTLNWQIGSQPFATASAFIVDSDDRDGCEIHGYAELTNAIPIFGLLILLVAIAIFVVTSIGAIVFLIWLVLYVMATRGAIRWRDRLVGHLMYGAQIIPENRDDLYVEGEFDEQIDLLVNGIKQGT